MGILVADKVMKISFEDEDSKAAYLKACKWLASNIISKVEVGEMLYQVVKVKDTDLPTFEVRLYISLDEGEFVKSTCDRCREFHSLFYLNQQFNCDACNMQAYRKQLETKLKIKRSHRKSQINTEQN